MNTGSFQYDAKTVERIMAYDALSTEQKTQAEYFFKLFPELVSRKLVELSFKGPQPMPVMLSVAMDCYGEVKSRYAAEEAERVKQEEEKRKAAEEAEREAKRRASRANGKRRHTFYEKHNGSYRFTTDDFCNDGGYKFYEDKDEKTSSDKKEKGEPEFDFSDFEEFFKGFNQRHGGRYGNPFEEARQQNRNRQQQGSQQQNNQQRQQQAPPPKQEKKLTETEEFFVLIGISYTTDMAAIKRPYRVAVAKYHSDKSEGLSPQEAAENERKTKLLTVVYGKFVKLYGRV